MATDDELRAVFRNSERNGRRPAPDLELAILRHDDATDILLPHSREGYRVSHLVAIRRAGEDRLLPPDEIDARVRRAVVALARATINAEARNEVKRYGGGRQTRSFA